MHVKKQAESSGYMGNFKKWTGVFYKLGVMY